MSTDRDKIRCSNCVAILCQCINFSTGIHIDKFGKPHNVNKDPCKKDKL